MTGERLDELKLGMMVTENTAPMGTAFTVTWTRDRSDHRHLRLRPSGHDPHAGRPADARGRSHRARPRVPLRPRGAASFVGPATRGGRGSGATGRLSAAGVICEVLDETGGMARLPELTDLARRYQLR